MMAGVPDGYLRGRLLVAAPVLTEATFARSVVLVLDHDGDGALGVVLNRPDGPPVAEVLPGWEPAAGEPPVVFLGGPVSPQTAVCLGRVRPAAEPAGFTRVEGPVGIVEMTEQPQTAAYERLRVFAGYAGWAAGQLEGELEAGAWYVVDSWPDDPFHPHPRSLWPAVLRRQSGPLRLLASYPPDPRLN